MADGVATRFNTVSYSAADERRLAQVGFAPSARLLPQPGRRPGPGLEVTVGGSPEAVTVQPGGGIILDGSTTAYVFALPSAKTIQLAARPSTGTSRIDLVVARIYDTDVHSSTALRELDVEIVPGTESATPDTPALPAGALQLAALTIPDTGTISIGSKAMRTAAAGGIIPVASQTERDALTLYDGLMVYREDTDAFEARIGGTWEVTATDWQNYTPALTNITKGNGSVTGRWRQVGKTVDATIILTVGSTTTASGTLIFTPPVPAAATAVAQGAAVSQMSPFIVGVPYLNGTNSVQVQGTTSAGSWNASQLPAATKTVQLAFRYEAA